MRNQLFKIIKSNLSFALLATVLLGSCKKFLHEPIDNRSTITQIKDIEKTVVSIMPTSDHHFTDFMSDDYSYKDIAGHVVRDISEKMTPIFTFAINRQSLTTNEMLQQGVNPNISFLRYYYRINNANLLIDRAEALKSKGEDTARINNVVGHALAIRAYCNFMLVNLFAKQYNAATASTDPGIPYIGEYNPKALVNRPRSSVAFIYDRIEEDWLKAVRLIDEGNTFFNTKFYFNKRAIYGLLSRFYLNKKDWASVIKYADLTLAIDKTPLNISNLRNQSANNSDAYSRSYFNPTEPSHLLMGNNTFQLISYFWSGFYPYPYRQFIGTSTRAGADEFIQTSPLFADFIPIKFIFFFGSRLRFNMPLITVDEVLYNKAEASAESEGGVFNASVKGDLRTLIASFPFQPEVAQDLTNRMDAVSNRAEAIDYILTLKRVRFFAEGNRWFDLKRHQIPVVHEFNGTQFRVGGANSEDYVIKLPIEEIQFNKDI